jgi:copper chaperone CopZ
MKQLKLEVSGMTCGHCVNAVRDALGNLPGVKVESVSVGSATVSIDETNTTIGDLIDAIGDAGYEANEAA